MSVPSWRHRFRRPPRPIWKAPTHDSVNSSDIDFSLDQLQVDDRSDDDKIQFQITLSASRDQSVVFDFDEQLSDAAASIDGQIKAPLSLQFDFSTLLTSSMSSDETADVAFTFDNGNTVSAVLSQQSSELLTGDARFRRWP